MRHGRQIVIAVTTLLFLAGCASPRYQTAYRYEPPVDSSGKKALEKCALKLEACQQHCSAELQICQKEIEPLVEKRTAEALKKYELLLVQYQLARQRYELTMSMNWGYDPFWGDPRFYHPWPRPYYYPPLPPEKPDRDAVFNQVQHEKCDVDCHCLSQYDACFLAAGGKKIPEERCIANCPEKK